MVHVTSRIIGDHPAALRLPAFAGGVLLIPATAWLGWTVSRNRFAALLAALAVAGSSALIEYSANARGYSWLALFSVLLAVLTLKLLAEPGRRVLWLGWAIVGGLGAYTLPVMILPVAGSFVFLLFATIRLRMTVRSAAARESVDDTLGLCDPEGIKESSHGGGTVRAADDAEPVVGVSSFVSALKGRRSTCPSPLLRPVGAGLSFFARFPRVPLRVTRGYRPAPLRGDASRAEAGVVGCEPRLMPPDDAARPDNVASLKGLVLMAGLCGLLIGSLYLPVVLVEGPSKLLATREMAYGILGQQTPTFGQMMVAAGALMCRHAPAAWMGVVVLGLGLFGAGLLRASRLGGSLALPPETAGRFALFTSLGVAVALAGVMRAPLPARAWLFALPLILVCAADGLARLLDVLRSRVAVVGIASITLVLGVLGGRHVTGQPRLCAEPGGLVEVEDAVRACRDFGADRCAILGRYTPALAYYRHRLDVPYLAPPDAASTGRVYIISDAERPVARLWNPTIAGFDRFGPPSLWSTAGEARIYMVERHPASASAD
jgi:hypothetical protein